MWGLPLPRGSLGWRCTLLEDLCRWALKTDDVGPSKPSKCVKKKTGNIQYICHSLMIMIISLFKCLCLRDSNLTSVETGELALLGSAVQLSEGPCKGDLGLQWSPVGEGDCPSVWIFCAELGWM